MPDLCPSRDVLQQYAVGTDLGANTASVERHLAECGRCLEALQTFDSDDVLIHALRSQGTGRRFNNPVVEGLRLQLRQLPFSCVSVTVTPPVVQSHETTPHGLPAANGPNGFLSPPQTPGELGRLGKFRILKELGHGGMGVVYLAEDTSLARKVALKVMNPHLAESGSGRERFKREARTAAQLQHVNIVTIHEVGDERGVLFLAMPFLQGESLEDRLRRGPLPLGEALRIARETAEGLAAAHELDLIHRDIKPANLFLEGSRATVKILDFGLARPVEGDSQLTQSGVAVGTPAYMPPEQIGGHAEQRSDLFSLGCVLYRLVTGHLPFPGRHPGEIFPNILLGRYRPVPELAPSIPAPIAGLIHNLLAVEPAARPASAAVVATVLKTFEARFASPPSPPSLDVPTVALAEGPTQVLPASRRRSASLLLAACAATAAVLLIGGTVTLVLALQVASWLRPSNAVGTDKELASRDYDKKDRESNPIDKPGQPVIPTDPPLQPIPTGAPLPGGLVSRPQLLPGVAAWDIQLNRNDWRRLHSLEFAPDGKLNFIEEGTNTRYQFDFVSAALTLHPKPDAKKDGIVWSPDGKTHARIAGKVVQLLDDRGERVTKTLAGPVDNPLVAISWSPNGQYLVGIEKIKYLWAWDLKQGGTYSYPLSSINDDGNYRFDWAGDSKTLVVQPSYPCYVLDFQPLAQEHKEPRLVAQLRGSGAAVCWSKDYRTVAVTAMYSSSWQTAVIPLAGGKTHKEVGVTAAAAWSPTGSPLAFAFPDGTVRLTNVHSWSEEASLKCGRSVQHLAFSPDGRTLAAFIEDRRLLFWDVKEARLLGTFVLLPDRRWFAFVPEGHHRGSDGVEKLLQLQYTARAEGGDSVKDFAPSEFTDKFGWKNEPDRVRLLLR